MVKELHEQANRDITIALVGNKLDLVEDDSAEDGETLRKVSVEEGQSLADEEGLLFFETSAKTGNNVNEVFVGIGSKIPSVTVTGGEAQEGSNGRRIDLTANTDNANAPRSTCC